MKRLICVLLILSMLMGCGRQVISPVQEAYASPAAPVATFQPTATPSEAPTPDPTATPRPSLATYPPLIDSKALFPEEILSADLSRMTPIEALNTLYRLQETAKKEKPS